MWTATSALIEQMQTTAAVERPRVMMHTYPELIHCVYLEYRYDNKAEGQGRTAFVLPGQRQKYFF